jgi:hypothetical protein
MAFVVIINTNSHIQFVCLQELHIYEFLKSLALI